MRVCVCVCSIAWRQDDFGLLVMQEYIKVYVLLVDLQKVKPGRESKTAPTPTPSPRSASVLANSTGCKVCMHVLREYGRVGRRWYDIRES